MWEILRNVLRVLGPWALGMVCDMSRVYRALEKAEKERQEKLKTETTLRVVEEIVIPKREETIQRVPEEKIEEIEHPPQEERPVLVAEPDSFAAEQFRKLKTQIFHRLPSPPRTILITSAVPDEGKTMVSLNLALAISQEIQKKAVLVGADLRKPSIYFDKQPIAKGLSNYLSDQVPLSEVLVRLGENLWVIPGGLPSRKASELIGSGKMRDLLTSLRELGDDTYVIIDSPPILSTADPILLSRMVEGVILVVMADRTPKQLIRRAVQSIDRQKILGIVLNEIELKPTGYYSQYYYGHYHKK